MIRRYLQDVLSASLKHFPVVLLLGSRQVGKSTLAQSLASDAWPARYLTLDDRTVLDGALTDPDGFVRGAGAPVVIDEVQRAPDVLRAIKLAVDRDRTNGRFLLTGSANILTLGTVSETLAGRVAVHHLRPFSARELRAAPPSLLLDLLFEAESAAEILDGLRAASPPADPDATRRFLVHGGYPTPALMEPGPARNTWFESYRQTYIERDLRDLAQISSLPEFSRLMTTLNLNTAQTLNIAGLSRQLGLPQTTLRRYLNLLEQSFQFDALQPFSTNRAKRLVKTPKLYATDTGMACYLGGAEDWASLEQQQRVGPILETWVHAELRKLLDLATKRTEMYFWRTHAGREVDFVLERGGKRVGLEVKASASLDSRQLAALRGCREVLGGSWRLGLVLHGGVEALALDETTIAVPWPMALG